MVLELSDWLASDLSNSFREVASSTRIHLVEALPHVLSMFDVKLIDFVENRVRNITCLFAFDRL